MISLLYLRLVSWIYQKSQDLFEIKKMCKRSPLIANLSICQFFMIIEYLHMHETNLKACMKFI